GAEDFDPLVAIVEEEPPFAVQTTDAPPGCAELVVDAPRRLEIDVALDAPGLLVVADANYPGWVARVGGRDAPIVAVDHALRGVWLPAGAHRVDMAFEPASWSRGLLFASLGALALLLLLLLGRRRTD